MPVSLMHEASVFYTYEWCSVMQSLELPYQSLLKKRGKELCLLTPCCAFMYSTVYFFHLISFSRTRRRAAFSFDFVPYRSLLQ